MFGILDSKAYPWKLLGMRYHLIRKEKYILYIFYLLERKMEK